MRGYMVSLLGHAATHSYPFRDDGIKKYDQNQ